MGIQCFAWLCVGGSANLQKTVALQLLSLGAVGELSNSQGGELASALSEALGWAAP